MKEHLIQKLSWVAILSANFLIILLAVWMFWPYKTITFKNGEQKVLNKTLRGGSYLSYEVDYCKYTKIVPIVTKTFIDGILYVLPPNIAIEKPVGCAKIVSQVYIPKALPPGKYILKSSYRYQVNPVRFIDVVTETEKFEVLESTQASVLRLRGY